MSDGEVKIPQKEIDALVAAIEKMERRRRIMAAGYMVAAVVLVLGQILAFWIYAHSPQGVVMAWIYFIPFALVGVVFLIFGRWAKKKKP